MNKPYHDGGKVRQLDIYVRSMGKALRIIALFPDTPDGEVDANRFKENHDEAVVVAVGDGAIWLADKHDQGVSIGEG